MSATATLASPDAETLNITRQIKAKPERVFAAFTTFETMSEWFGPPGCDVQGGTVDFRVGGGYQIRMLTPGGEMVVAGEYREITPPRKLVFTWQWQDDEDWAPVESVVTIEFVAVGEETELRLTHTGFPNTDSRGNHGQGWGGSFDRLAALFAA